MRNLLLFLLVRFSNELLDSSFMHTNIDDDVDTEISDWSNAKTDDKIRIINFLIGLDASLTRYYNYDEERIKSATITLIHTVNQYFYPLNIRLSIVDILPVKGTHMGIDDFLLWKKEQRSLVDHDVSVLLRYNYEGGIAFSNGMCKKNSVMIIGYYPESTMNNAWVFMHQLAHVIGITHKITTNCKCNKLINPERCLKVRGFPACSVQEMVTKLSKHSCLETQNFELTKIQELRSISLPICGNGLLEKGEECDCGPERFCDNILCDSVRCKFIFQKSLLSAVINLLLALLSFGILLFIWKFCIIRLFRNVQKQVTLCFKREPNEDFQRIPNNENREISIPTSIVKMREPQVGASTAEARRSRLSDIYIQMRPISRFWEKFQSQNKDKSRDNI